MVCLETDFIVDLLRKKKEAIAKLEDLNEKNTKLSITPVSLIEIFHGAFKSGKKENIDLVEEMVSTLNLLEIDFFACRESGRLLFELEKKGKKIGDLDTITAAIVLRYGESLLTRNKKHFMEVKDLRLEKY